MRPCEFLFNCRKEFTGGRIKWVLSSYIEQHFFGNFLNILKGFSICRMLTQRNTGAEFKIFK